jgi:hypothetical protein
MPARILLFPRVEQTTLSSPRKRIALLVSPSQSLPCKSWLSAAVDFLASLGAGSTRRKRLRAAFQRLHERGDALIKQLWNGLRK